MSEELRARAQELLAQAFEGAGDAYSATLVRTRETKQRALIDYSLPLNTEVAVNAICAALSFASSAAGQREGWVDRLREAVTPTGETKAAYMGEFSWTDWVDDEDGIPQGHERVVPWPVIREIMAVIRERAGVDRMDEADCLAVIASPSAPKERRDEVALAEAQKTIRDALMDSQYLAGVTAGWNAANSDHPEAALAAIQESRRGHLEGFAEAKAVIAALTPVSQGGGNG